MERYSFFNSELDSYGQDDRIYSSEDLARYFSSFVGNGIYAESASVLQVQPKENMVVKVGAGKAWANGYFYENTEDKEFTLAYATGTLARIDSIVLRLDLNERTFIAAKLEGSGAVVPVAPTLTRNDSVYELRLANIYIASGAVTIQAANITDTRFTSECGIVTGVVEQIDTEGLFAQYNNSFNSWFDTIKGQLGTDAAGALQAQINTINDAKGAVNGFAMLDTLGVVKTATGNISGMDLHSIIQSGFYYGTNVSNAIDANPYYFLILAQDNNNAIVLTSRSDVNKPEWFVQTNVAGTWSWWINIDNGARWNSLPKTGGPMTGYINTPQADTAAAVRDTLTQNSGGSNVNSWRIVTRRK